MNYKRIFIIIVSILFAVISPVNILTTQAALDKRPVAVQVDSLSSNEKFRNEYFKIRTPDNEKYVIYVTGKVNTNVKRLCIRIKKHGTDKVYITSFVKPNAKGEFSIKINTKKGNKKVPAILNKKGTITKANQSVSTCPGYRAVQQMTAGIYHLSITAATTKADANVSKGSGWMKGTLGGKDAAIYKEAVFTVKKGQANNLKLVQYNAVINNNQKVRALYEKTDDHIEDYQGSFVRYQDVYMKDIPFVFRNPKTQEIEYMTKEQVQYIDKTAKKIVSGCSSDYQKVLKIYEYVSKNLYYDNLALREHKNQYANPYSNLFNIRNKVKSANSINGKVATTCQGYAALVVALARAENIPARFIYGRHIHQPGTVWSDVAENDLNTVTHYWSEVYVNGKWIVVDARSAMKSSWRRKTFNDKGTWVKKRFINYSHFDPTDEQLASSYIYVGVYPGSKDGKYINRIDETEQLQSFLEMKSEYGIKNGKLLNTKYDKNDFSTWGVNEEDDFLTNGYGRVSEINWAGRNLSGNPNFSSMKRLKSLVLKGNDLSSINLYGCKKLTYLDLRGNELRKVKFSHKGRNVSVQCTEDGDFSLLYNKDSDNILTIYSNPIDGYVCIGLYNSSGEFMKADESGFITFEPKSDTYTLRFTVKETVNGWNDLYKDINVVNDDNAYDTDIDSSEENVIDEVTGEVIIDKETGEVVE